jgi:hypothetical protein
VFDGPHMCLHMHMSYKRMCPVYIAHIQSSNEVIEQKVGKDYRNKLCERRIKSNIYGNKIKWIINGSKCVRYVSKFVFIYLSYK